MRLYKWLIPVDEPIYIDGYEHRGVVVVVLANDLVEAQKELHEFAQQNKYNADWAVAVPPIEIEINHPKVITWAEV